MHSARTTRKASVSLAERDGEEVVNASARLKVPLAVGSLPRARARARTRPYGGQIPPASGEYCFNSGLGTMVHFATQPERTLEDVVYEFYASGLIAAGLDPARLQQLPEIGRMTPGEWYFLPMGQQDPHHAHAMAKPTIAIAINVK